MTQKKTHTYLRSMFFLLLLFFLLALLSQYFLPKGNTLEDGIQEPELYAFLGEPENSLEAVVLGDSIPLSSFIPAYLWRDYGIPSYVCAATAQKPSDGYFLLKRFFRTQSPRVVLYETDQLYLDTAASDLVQAEALSRLPVFQYHDSWKFVRPNRLLSSPGYTETSPLKGYHLRKTPEGLTKDPAYLAPEEAAEPISFWNRLCLERTLALCRKQGTRLVLYTAPNAATWTQGRHLAMEALARELGISYLDANGENLDINWTLDTLDRGEHLNYRGAAKVTAWLGAYLQTQGLEDRRDSAAYASWQEDLETFQAMLDDPENYY